MVTIAAWARIGRISKAKAQSQIMPRAPAARPRAARLLERSACRW